MSNVINNNLVANNAQRNLNTTATSYAKRSEKLSSGLRINKAADDAAGLFVSEKLRSQTNGLNQAGRNAQDGISLIQTAEGALNETHSILQRMRELTVQAANDTLGASDREAIKSEMTELSKEVTRIADTTEFNGKNLLAGGLAKTTAFSSVTAAGLNAGNIGVSLGGTSAAGTYHVDITAVATAATVAKGAGAKLTTTTQTNANTLTINGQTIALTTADTNAGIVAKINAITDKTGVFAAWNTDGIQLSTVAKGSGAALVVTSTAASFFVDANMTAGGTTTATKVAGADAAATLSVSGGASTGALTGTGGILTQASTGMKIDVSGATGTGDFDLVVGDGGTAYFQIGANTGQVLDLAINKMGAQDLGVDDLNISSNSVINTAGTGALAKLDAAIAKVSNERSLLGAKQNRLEHTIKNLAVSSENLTASESRIRDLDIAQEMVGFTKDGILQQAGTAILAQANQSGQGVLQLMRG